MPSISARVMILVAGLSWCLAGCDSTKHKRLDETANPGAVANSACLFCGKSIPSGAGVVARIADSNDRRAYRCIHCALSDLHNETRDVELVAHSPESGAEIVLNRRKGLWSAVPATTVYLILPEHADECLDVHQPFATMAEFEGYVQRHPEIAAQNPRAYTIEQYKQMLDAGRSQS
jgi:hypothetical protein